MCQNNVQITTAMLAFVETSEGMLLYKESMNCHFINSNFKTIGEVRNKVLHFQKSVPN